MAIRIVYVLSNKAPDLIAAADTWHFTDGTLKVLGPPTGSGQRKKLVEIREDFILSVEHIDLAGSVEKAPERSEKAPDEAPKPKKRAKKAR